MTSVTRMARKGHHKNKGFTLIEIMIGITIFIALSGIVIFSASEVLRRGRVTSAVGAADSAKNAITNYVMKPGSLGTLPLTEGTIPAAYFNGTGTNTTNVAAAASLDQVMLTEGVLEKPLSLSMGPQSATPTGSVAVTWSTANNRFQASAAPTVDKSSITRLEARVSAPATAPALAQGANFWLDGTNALDANVRVAYMVIPNVPVADAYELSLSVDKSALSEADNTTVDNRGSVVYAAPATDGSTTVYYYITKY